MRILFVNSDVERSHCSIFESGAIAAHAMLDHSRFDVTYLPTTLYAFQSDLADGYDVVIFNYHPNTLRIHVGELGALHIPKILFSFERRARVSAWDIPSNFGVPLDRLFEFIAIPDPELVAGNDHRVIKLPRVVPPYELSSREVNTDHPTISTFGITPYDKSHLLLAAAADKEFEHSTLRLHFPKGSWAPDSWSMDDAYAECKTIASSVDVQLTDEYMPMTQLLDWLAESDLNAFLYDPRRDTPDHFSVGNIPCAPDQAVATGRPLTISDSICANHYLRYIEPFPKQSLKASMLQNTPKILAMREDWSAATFANTFDEGLIRCLAI